jgi:hypothetical protein
MTTIPRIEQLKEAYEWEQDRIQAWVDEMNNNPGDQENPMIVRFRETWVAYFDEITASNDAVVATCDDALALQTPEAAFNATRRINRVTHRKASLLPIVDAAQIRKTQSRYFEALDVTLELEDEARDYIERFLVG